jgi:hypothetical protein
MITRRGNGRGRPSALFSSEKQKEPHSHEARRPASSLYIRIASAR